MYDNETHENLIEEIFNEIENVENNTNTEYTTIPLNSTQRAQVHEYGKNKKLDTMTICVPGLQTKKVIIYKNNNVVDDYLEQKINITKEMITFFSDFSLIPIPVPNPEYLQYYLDNLKDFYNCNMWEIFLNDVKKIGFKNLIHESLQVKIKIINYIKENNEYIKFKNTLMIIPNEIITKKNIYQHNYTGKHFVSIDIKSANFTLLKTYCPSIGNSWEEIVKMFSSCDFLSKSKYLRQIIFGELGDKRLMKNMIIFVKYVNDLIKSHDINSSMEKVVCSNDEIIYEVPENFKLDSLQQLVDKIDPERKIYRVEKFKLLQFDPYPYYLKVLTTGKNQLKGIEKIFLMQCIKHYKNEQITELDRKFIHANCSANFDESLTFSKPFFL